jgi:hypothetical protein
MELCRREIISFFHLMHLPVVILYIQQTRQASIRKDMLKSGGFLFFKNGGGGL